MNMVAFLMTPLVSASLRNKKAELPTFKQRWWYRNDRLDARPVAWSLLNRPDDWRFYGSATIVHTPSNHRFWTHYGFERLLTDNCSCADSGGRFQIFHKRIFRRAFRKWQNDRMEPIHTQFVNHFIRNNNEPVQTGNSMTD